MIGFEYGPNIGQGSAAYHDLSAILDGAYEAGATLPEDPRLIVDVGANVGAFSHWAHRRFPHATIVSFEPQPEAFELLRRNMRGCSRSILLPFAASSISGEVRRLYRGGCTLGESSLEQIGQQSASFDMVPLMRVDQIVHTAPSILKIDTEGHEIDVLAGCSRWPGGFFAVDFIAMEIHRRSDEAPIVALMKDYGLRMAHRELESGCEDRIVAKFDRSVAS